MNKDQLRTENLGQRVNPQSQPSYYTIRFKGLVDPQLDWLEGLTVNHLETGETLLFGPITDQSALHGLLARIRDMNLTLLAVNQVDIKDI